MKILLLCKGRIEKYQVIDSKLLINLGLTIVFDDKRHPRINIQAQHLWYMLDAFFQWYQHRNALQYGQ